jgi:hypothetical protein
MKVGFAALGLAALLATGGTALAADKIRVGKAVQVSFPMSVMELGVDRGFFAKNDIELEITSFTGDAKLQAGFCRRFDRRRHRQRPGDGVRDQGCADDRHRGVRRPARHDLRRDDAGFADQDLA